ncbi:MAG TPA: hypothetical protein VKA74_11295 [Myxococcota bacterium]|nr:hypothetical protein [Myxococcota bacterium]
MSEVERTPPMISTEQMIALHGFLAEAAAEGESELSEISGCETEVEVREIRCTPLGRFGEEGLRLSEDLVAGVMGRMEGALPGSLAGVLEPEEALRWARIGGGDDPLETFVRLGRTLLAGIAAALGEILGSPAPLHSPRLVEQPELTMLFRTHAPPETWVLSARLGIRSGDVTLPAQTHLLIEPKNFARLLSALSTAGR